MKDGYLHFQIDDYMRLSHKSYHGPGTVGVLRKHLVINVVFFPLPILSNTQQVKRVRHELE